MWQGVQASSPHRASRALSAGGSRSPSPWRHRQPSPPRWCANNLNSPIKGNVMFHTREKKGKGGKWLLVFERGSQSDWAEGGLWFWGLSLFFIMALGLAARLQEIWWAVKRTTVNFSFFLFFFNTLKATHKEIHSQQFIVVSRYQVHPSEGKKLGLVF